MAEADLQHQTAYGEFPDGPDAYREATFYETLRRLFQSAVRHAESRIKWYDEKATHLKPTAQRLRWWSLIFFAIGTLAPIVASAISRFADLYGSNEQTRDKWNYWDYAAHWPLAEIGYVLLGIA